MTEKWIKRIAIAAILVMAVVGVRLNQHDSVQAAKAEVRVEVLRATYEQDVESWHDRVRGCERAKDDRIAQRRGWRTARDRARRAAATTDDPAERAFQLGARRTYSEIVMSLSTRIEPLDCDGSANPKPKTPDGVSELP